MDNLPKMYIETTIPSYIAARDSRDILKFARQLAARRFWDNQRQNFDLYISEFVYDECAQGDKDAAGRRLALLHDIKFIETTSAILNLAPVYKGLLAIPDNKQADALHLAAAVIAGMDYVLNYNFTHMGIDSYGKLLRYNDGNGLKTPLLVAPDYFRITEETNDNLL